MNEHTSLRAGIAGGSLLSIFLTLDLTDITKSLVLGILGTATSIVTAQLMKKLQQALRKKPE